MAMNRIFLALSGLAFLIAMVALVGVVHLWGTSDDIHRQLAEMGGALSARGASDEKGGCARVGGGRGESRGHLTTVRPSQGERGRAADGTAFGASGQGDLLSHRETTKKDATPFSEDLNVLRTRVARLEEIVATLRSHLAVTNESVAALGEPVGSLVELQQERQLRKNLTVENQERFRGVMAAESEEDPESFAAATELYRQGLKALKDGNTAGLARLVEEYPESNRAACAAVQLARYYEQSGDGATAEEYLAFALDGNGTGFFRDGVEVVAEAMFLQGSIAWRKGDGDKAMEIWNELSETYPHSVTHSGIPFTEAIEREKAGY